MMNSDPVYPLLQFVALALPAIAIYLQVLVSLFQTWKQGGENPPDSLITFAQKKWTFRFALSSLFLFLFAALLLVFRLTIASNWLVSVGRLFVQIALVSFATSILLVLYGSVDKLRQE